MARHDPCDCVAVPGCGDGAGCAELAFRSGVADPEFVQATNRTSAAVESRIERATMADPTARTATYSGMPAAGR
jgi:hypothetical protein